MSIQYVQGIIINENKVLHAYGSNSNNIPMEFFFRGEIKTNESPLDAIRREIKEQLGITPNTMFQLKEEIIVNATTFLIDIEKENISPEDIKISRNITGIILKGFKWVSLYDGEKFDSTETTYLKKAYFQCLEEGYDSASTTHLEKFSLANSTYSYETARLLDKKRIISSRNTDKKISYGEKLGAIAFALFLGIIFRIFFDGKNLGISVAIFTTLFFTFFFWVSRKRITFKPSIGWLLLIPTFLAAINFSIHSNIFIMPLNILILPLLVTITTMLLCYKELSWDKLSFITVILKKGTMLTLENCHKPAIFIIENLSSKNKKETNPVKKNIIKGLLISVPLLLIIFPLLTSADMVFKFYITKTFGAFQNINIWNSIRIVVLVLLVAIYIFGFVWGFKYSFNEGSIKPNRAIQWEPVTLITIISIINIVYLVFTIIQFSYLYCGGVNSLPNGYSFSQYAREGFFELVAVAVINIGILLCSMRFMSKQNNTLNYVSKISLSVLVVFTLNMLFSAHYKMNLYETAYGFTQLRVYVHLFMVLLFLLILIAFASMWFKRIPMIKASIVVTVLMYIVLNYADVDTFVAKKNIERYRETGKIDIQYLTCLSYDALPEIIKLKNDPNAEVAKEVNSYLENRKTELSTNHSWMEFNLSKDRARKALNIK